MMGFTISIKFKSMQYKIANTAKKIEFHHSKRKKYAEKMTCRYMKRKDYKRDL